MQFTQEQARGIANVPAETLRYWRKVVPYLAAKSGKGARFSFSDLVALAATQETVSGLGLKIAEVGLGVDSLFRLFAEASWSSLDGAVVTLDTTTAELHYPGEIAELPLSGPTILIPCGPVVRRLRGELLHDTDRETQRHLPFPPQAVRSA